jgi:serine/threonine-protein kinase HipA
MASVSLQVLLGSLPVGELRLGEHDVTEFRLLESYKSAYPRPVLGQQFVDDIEGVWRARSRLPSWFSNLLPEGELREFLARAAGVPSRREFHLLWQLADDLPGALRLAATQPVPQSELFEEDPKSEKSLDGDWHFSLAGVQLKFSANRQGRGLTVPVSGRGGSWILKLPDARYPLVPQNEYATMRWAKASGIEVPEVDLVPISGIEGLPQSSTFAETHAFAVRRFDRGAEGARIHMEDFAQVFGLFPEQKYSHYNYESIARVLLQLSGSEALIEFLRRFVFVAASGNGDAHHKNWSLLYPDHVHAQLSPAYDFVSTVQYLGDDRLALNFARSRDWAAITADGFRRLAEKIEVDETIVLEAVRSSVAAVRESWQLSKRDFGFWPEAIQVLDEHMRKVPILSM